MNKEGGENLKGEIQVELGEIHKVEISSKTEEEQGIPEEEPFIEDTTGMMQKIRESFREILDHSQEIEVVEERVEIEVAQEGEMKVERVSEEITVEVSLEKGMKTVQHVNVEHV